MAQFCKNCNTELNGKFCSNCGQKAKLEKINGHYIKHEIEHVLHLEKGFFYTIKELVIRPGKSVREYLTENRSRLVKPIIFIIVTSLIYSLVKHYFHMEKLYSESTTAGVIINWFSKYSGYGSIVIGGFIALFIKLFFRKHNYNFYEILILICYVSGASVLIGIPITLIEGLAHLDLALIGAILSMIYVTFAIADFFDRRKPLNYVKSFFAYILGIIICLYVAYFIGTIIDFINK